MTPSPVFRVLLGLCSRQHCGGSWQRQRLKVTESGAAEAAASPEQPHVLFGPKVQHRNDEDRGAPGGLNPRRMLLNFCLAETAGLGWWEQGVHHCPCRPQHVPGPAADERRCWPGTKTTSTSVTAR